MKPGKIERSSTTDLPQSQARDLKNNNKKVSNKGLCPFRCPNCESLGGELVKNRYQVSNIIEDNNQLIFEPFGRDLIK